FGVRRRQYAPTVHNGQIGALLEADGDCQVAFSGRAAHLEFRHSVRRIAFENDGDGILIREVSRGTYGSQWDTPAFHAFDVEGGGAVLVRAGEQVSAASQLN